MKIQSLSIVVPTSRCMNDCPFCVSKMHDNQYENRFSVRQMRKRLLYAEKNGVTNVIFTGTGEAIQNKAFLRKVTLLLDEMNHPFPNVELQTTGVLLDDLDNLRLLNYLGVNTISLSVSDIFDDTNNMKIIGVPKKAQFGLKERIQLLKKEGFNIRLSLNMTSSFDGKSPEQILEKSRDLGANQLTFRRLYTSGKNSPEDRWVEENSCDPELIDNLDLYIKEKGNMLYELPYGSIAYSINGMSTVVDLDCMNKENNQSLKYIILREDGKLYCQWDDDGSLIF